MLCFLPFMESLYARFGILAQISLPHILDSLTAKMISILHFLKQNDSWSPVEYCGVC